MKKTNEDCSKNPVVIFVWKNKIVNLFRTQDSKTIVEKSESTHAEFRGITESKN